MGRLTDARPHAREPGRLEGVLVAAATPRRAERHSIDLGATLELIDFLGASGADAIVLLSCTGEFVHFALEDRRRMVRFVARRSRLPLIVNVTHSTLDGAIELARDAAASGAAGLLLMPPVYFRSSQDAIRSFYLSFAAAIGEAAPIYLHAGIAGGNRMSVSTGIQLLATGLFAGFQDSGGNLDDVRALAQELPQNRFLLLSGDERTYVEARALGARGIVSGIASAVPELLVSLEEALRSGVKERITRLEARIIELLNWTEQLPFPAGIKEAAKLRQLPMGAPAAPLAPEEERKLEEFQAWFRGWLPRALSECRL